jgi:hypothetical protein
LQLPPPVDVKKIAENYFKLKPYNIDLSHLELATDTPSDFCVEFCCQLEGGRGQAAFVRM